MIEQYVFTVSRRATNRPLSDKMVLEFGVTVDDPLRFAEAVAALAQVMKDAGTPEKAAKLAVDHAINRTLKTVIKG